MNRMTPQELAELMHEAHFDLRFNGDLNYDFCFMYMEWEHTHMTYQGKMIAIAQQILRRVRDMEEIRSNNDE